MCNLKIEAMDRAGEIDETFVRVDSTGAHFPGMSIAPTGAVTFSFKTKAEADAAYEKLTGKRAGELPLEKKMEDREMFRPLKNLSAAEVTPQGSAVRAVAGCALRPKKFILDDNGLSYDQIAAISKDYNVPTHIVSCIVNAAIEAAPLPDLGSAAVRGEAVAKSTDHLYGEVMNIPCTKTLSHFVGQSEFQAYKIGHRDARHAAADLIAAFSSSARAADAPSEPSELEQQLDLANEHLRQAVKNVATAKNFHRSLCDRFGYCHDDKEWLRDLVSLEEFIARKVKSRVADLVDSQPTKSADEVRAQVRDAVAANMTDLYICSRHRSAWGAGTMGLDDFSPAGDSEDVIANIADAVLDAITPPSSQPTDGGVRNG